MEKPEFFGSTTIGERGQVVIPAEAREKFELEKGEKLLVMGLHNGAIMLTKLSSFQKFSEEMARRQEEMNKILRDM